MRTNAEIARRSSSLECKGEFLQSQRIMLLSGDQKQAFDLIGKWLRNKNRKQSFILAGYAGTGKSTLISSLRALLTTEKIIKDTFRIAYCSYTGKASLVLKNYLLAHGEI